MTRRSAQGDEMASCGTIRPDACDGGYTAIEDYAAIGDGRTVALVSAAGSVDWLCLPDLDSPSVFARVLDATRGGHFSLAPDGPFAVERRYVPDTNVLETTVRTATGVARITDAMLLADAALAPHRELLRKVEGVSGRVAFRWLLEPRFGYGSRRVRIVPRAGVPVAEAGADAIALCTWDAGQATVAAGTIEGGFTTANGSAALLVLVAAHQEPLVFPSRRDVEQRLASTVAFWQRWAAGRAYGGRWRDAVVRSALALKLLVFAPSGAIAAAATTSLPEVLGGERNWDYRYSWVRDSAFTLQALLRLGELGEAEAYFWWLLHASQLTHPRLQVLYRLDGGPRARERTLGLNGYRGSRPVRIGNDAARQRQLDIYGELLHAACLYAASGRRLDNDTGRRLAEIADLVARLWRQPDAGIWEVRSEAVHFTHSKMLCWVALQRAAALADAGSIPDRAARWRRQAAPVRDFIEERCWSPATRSYVQYAGSDQLDAAVLFGGLMGYQGVAGRLSSTIDAIRHELGDGVLVDRYHGDDGLGGNEGAFLTCSFWLAEALARDGRIGDAVHVMEQLVAMANDVGLYAEEIDPASGGFLGNVPQGLVHLALINAAITIEQAAAS